MPSSLIVEVATAFVKRARSFPSKIISVKLLSKYRWLLENATLCSELLRSRRRRQCIEYRMKSLGGRLIQRDLGLQSSTVDRWFGIMAKVRVRTFASSRVTVGTRNTGEASTRTTTPLAKPAARVCRCCVCVFLPPGASSCTLFLRILSCHDGDAKTVRLV